VSHKKSIQSFFPKSTISKHSTCDGYLVSVDSESGTVLLYEFGRTRQEAWRNAYTRLFNILKHVIGLRATFALLTKPAVHGESDGVHQGTMESGKA
jgi:hypothetical protein